jgi:DHA1 family bicyclomycin/chloramphenicol resistance-like MFS transporter
MAVFIMVPVLAPAIGQGIMLVAHWRAIFVMLLAVALIALAWFALRQPETLPPARRTPFSLRGVAAGVRETFSHRAAFGYTMMAGLIFGSFVGYLISAPQIFLRQYHTGGAFALYSVCSRPASASPWSSTRAWSWSGACSSCAASR